MNSYRAETWSQELLQRPLRGAAYLLVYHDLLSFFSLEPRTTSTLMAPPTTGWAFLHQSLIKKMPFNWILHRDFFN